MDNPELDRTLQEAYARYCDKMRKNPKVTTIWSFEEWTDKSNVARNIINEDYRP